MNSPNKVLLEIFENPKKYLVPILLMAVGYLIYLLSKEGIDLFTFVRDRGLEYLGAGLGMIGFLWIYLDLIRKLVIKKKDGSFSDVDARRREKEGRFSESEILEEIRELKEKHMDIDYDRLERIISKQSPRSRDNREKTFDKFENYFDDLSTLLEDQAITADEKASILLDKGTSYSRNGIYFFIVTIAVWQLLAYLQGLQQQHIYGIISCSLLFVFIEFLSAWFLKQYRHYVDTSTYLLKVKSIFDRYMLSFLALKSEEISSDPEKCTHIIDILSEDIRWPETYLLKNADVSFAKEAMETMTHFAKAMKSEAKGTAKKSATDEKS